MHKDGVLDLNHRTPGGQTLGREGERRALVLSFKLAAQKENKKKGERQDNEVEMARGLDRRGTGLAGIIEVLS